MDRNERNKAQKLEGVFSRGYGVVPRSVMLSGDLTPEAKALYAYYCVTSGNSGGYQSSPREELILKTMHISHTRFIKHRKSLIERNLISFMQPKRESGKPLFETSRFLIVKSPREGSLSPAIPEQAPLNSLAAVQEGVFSEGFGLVPKMVLYDAELSVEAKAAYIFLCVFANASTSGSRSANPSSALLQDKLMTRKRVQHALNELICAGYIRRERLHKGAFAGMLYILNFRKNDDDPKDDISIRVENDTAKNIQLEVKNDTADNPIQQSLFDTAEKDSDIAENSMFSVQETRNDLKVENDTAYEVPDKAHIKTTKIEAANIETAENETVYINKKQKTKDEYNNIRQISHKKAKDKTDGSDTRAKSFIELKTETEKQIDADILSERYGKEIINSLVMIIADVYSAGSGKIRINGRECEARQAAEIYRTLRSHHIEYVLEKVAQQGEIANLQNYLYSCLYNAAMSYELEIFRLSRM